MPADRPGREQRVYATEERFVELFTEAFGHAAAAKLVPQHPYIDLDGRGRFIDFALESLLDKYAIEIDGETYHHPQVISPQDFADQLVRQNSLIHQGWRVLRWSDWQLGKEPDRVREHISLLLDTPVRLVVPQEHLPAKRAASVPLYDHQEEALAGLKALRQDGNQIALLPHAVGAGKTTTAVEDARSLGLRTLFLAHTHELVDQALGRFAVLWPEASRARLGEADDEVAHVVVGTVQTAHSSLTRFAPNHFGYVVIDEAHHATARMYQAVLRYFNPEFLLGLTGTPERADGQDVLEVFRNTAPRMDLEAAVRAGILCDVRCFRVRTNIDLKNLRFSGTVYRRTDLEERVTIPERNELIVKTYCESVKGRRAVVFCVSVAHAQEMARRFREVGVPAADVSGELGREERQALLERYRKGELPVLCACNVLNEGWDAPETEVLLMARPTLSKVIYQQQLGRGMRKAPGKDSLILFDFVDVFSRHNQALSLNRLLKKAQYRAGRKIFGDDTEDGSPEEIPLHLWVTDFDEVELFDWQERVEGMITIPAVAKQLRVSEEWVRSRWLKGEIPADEVVEFGEENRTPFFLADRVPGIREQYGLIEVTEENLYEDFLRFVRQMDMAHSYKPVWFQALLECADERGKAPVQSVTERFRRFYTDRAERGLLVERGRSKMLRAAGLSNTELIQVINDGPFDKFSRMEFVGYASDRAFYQISPVIWRRLRVPEESAAIKQLLEEAQRRYYRDDW